MKSLIFQPHFSRRYPDPLNSTSVDEDYDIQHYIFICQVIKIPSDIPTTPNPRDQNVYKNIYKEIRSSLIQEEPTFHLKNKGITIVAKSVKHNETDKSYTVKFGDEDGIVDGGHTYRIIQESIEECPEEQFVKIEILTGLDKDLIVDIARGLNTSVQVQQMSLENLKKSFDWIKLELNDTTYAKRIAYKENEEGDFTIRDIISFMTLFNIDLFPERDGHPKVAYTSKEECLNKYIKNEASYKKLRPILKDILELYDYIQYNCGKLYNSKYEGKAGKLKFFQDKKRSKFQFIFINKESKLKLFDGALYPILGAFRCLIEKNPKDGTYRWKTKSFTKVKELFDVVGGDLINVTKNTSDNRGRNPNAIGKDESNWDNLYKTVALAYFQSF